MKEAKGKRKAFYNFTPHGARQLSGRQNLDNILADEQQHFSNLISQLPSSGKMRWPIFAAVILQCEKPGFKPL